MLSRVLSAAIHGIDGVPITVEVDYRMGLPAFSIVGLPDVGVREARERVIAALKNSGFSFPPQKITVNLAPGHIKKEGPSFDLAIAIGILGAAEILPLHFFEGFGFLGEVSLNGEVRPIRGVLPCALGLKNKGIKKIILAQKNAKEASLVDGVEVYGVRDLSQAVRFLIGEEQIPPFDLDRKLVFEKSRSYASDFSEVKGQAFAKRALEIAASGSHNILLLGPPGSGKTLLARRFPSILPDLSFEEALETTKIHSIAGYLRNAESLLGTRPFRSPHHGISASALTGGGSNPKPGEVSLAHRGVLFLDEFPEFGRNVLECLRQPLEDRYVTVARVANTVKYPSDFVLIAAANPCPCGYLGSQNRPCSCSPIAIQKYRAKISGPLLDRIDLHVEVPALKLEEMTETNFASENSAQIRARVQRARDIQRKRFVGEGIFENGQMGVRQIRAYCPLEPEGKHLLEGAIKKLGLSARAYDRLLRLSRTIADLAGEERILTQHLSEAISFRVLDRGQEGVPV